MPIYKSKTKPNINENIKQHKINYCITDIKPMLKWVGGKGQLIDRLMKKFPKKIKGNYYEMFVGGGSVFLELIKNIINNKIIINGDINVNDINSNLINLYQYIKHNPDDLIKNIQILKSEYHNIKNLKEDDEYNEKGNKVRKNTTKFTKFTKEDINTKEAFYYIKRNQYNKIKDDNTKKLERAALFIFLNKTCWRGIYRENADGSFNVPFGNYNTISLYNKRHILSLNYCFNKYNVNFYNEDYKIFNNRVKHYDFIYMDPPYFPATLKFDSIYVKNNKYYRNPIKGGKQKYIIDENGQPIPTGKSKRVFSTYNKDSFGIKEQENLRDICQILDEHNIKFILSNSCTNWIINEYDNFIIEYILCKRRINSKRPQDTDYEVLIYNL